ncbi:MAG: hypothetical protein QNJ72_10770 [Pleurocapsa sp. MO_226.B13]|nr:hypothetical protein [Pleurocapsa sp. MO_226.B13]
MDNKPKHEQETPVAEGGMQTPVDPKQRKTGQTSGLDTREGSEPEAPGARNDVAGDPNQGTEAR